MERQGNEDRQSVRRGYVWLISGASVGYILGPYFAVLFSVFPMSDDPSAGWIHIWKVLFSAGWWLGGLAVLLWSAVIASPAIGILRHSRMAAWSVCGFFAGIYFWVVLVFSYLLRYGWIWLSGELPAEQAGSRILFELVLFLFLPMVVTFLVAWLSVVTGRIVDQNSKHS